MAESLSSEALIEKYDGLIRSIAYQLKTRLSVPVEVDELMNYGRLGLLEAAKRFDPKVGVTFKTFAYYRVKGSMYDGLRKMDVISRRKNSRLQFETAATEFLNSEMAQGSGEMPRSASLKDDINEVYTLISGLVPIFFLTSDAMDRFLVDQKGKSLEDQASFQQEKATLRQAISQLPQKERSLLEYHYYQDLTLEDAASKLGLSKSWASRLHAKALNKLKDILKKSKK
jgi:RNA polymerase sigma factor for flagellar operon FliA